MLPVSGAAQLKARGASGLRPMISHSGAYSRLVSPAPYSGSGRKRFQRPSAFALPLSSSSTFGSWCGSPERSICSFAIGSAG